MAENIVIQAKSEGADQTMTPPEGATGELPTGATVSGAKEDDPLALQDRQSALEERAGLEGPIPASPVALDVLMRYVPAVCFQRTGEKILYVSSGYERIWQRPCLSLYENPESFIEAIYPEDRDQMVQKLASCPHTTPSEYEFRICRPDGEIRWIHCNTHYVAPAGGEDGFEVGIAHDITDRKLAEEKFKQQEILLLHAARLSTMGEMVAGIAHEVNQPFYSIMNYAKAVTNLLREKGDLDIKAIRDCSRDILDEAVRGGQIIKRMQSFVARGETERRQADLNEIVDESIKYVAAEARSGQVAIRCDLDNQLAPVMVDRVQIQQVLVNLYKNAIEAMTENPVEKRVMAISFRRCQDQMEVAVSDTGPGISAEHGKNILEPFQTTRPNGLGLGLAISHTIVENHEGHLSYGDNEGGGAIFRFTLPVVNSVAK